MYRWKILLRDADSSQKEKIDNLSVFLFYGLQDAASSQKENEKIDNFLTPIFWFYGLINNDIVYLVLCWLFGL